MYNLKKMKKRLKTIDDGKVLTPDEIRFIAKELDVTMALAGIRSIANIGRSSLVDLD